MRGQKSVEKNVPDVRIKGYEGTKEVPSQFWVEKLTHYKKE